MGRGGVRWGGVERGEDNAPRRWGREGGGRAQLLVGRARGGREPPRCEGRQGVRGAGMLLLAPGHADGERGQPAAGTSGEVRSASLGRPPGSAALSGAERPRQAERSLAGPGSQNGGLLCGVPGRAM